MNISTLPPEAMPVRSSMATLTVRYQYAAEVARLAGRLAREERCGPAIALELQSRLLHRLFRRIEEAGTHFFDVHAAMDRLERVGRRWLRRARRPAAARPVLLGQCVKTWSQFRYIEQRVLRLLDFQYPIEDIAVVLDMTPNAVEFYRNQAARKIHSAHAGVS